MTDTTTVGWRTESQWPNATDVQLAEKATDIVIMARYDADPQACMERELRQTFTHDEMRRAQQVLTACTLDVTRLTEIEARAGHLDDDTRWLVGQLRTAWEQLLELRTRINDAGSLMQTSYVASAVAYPRGFDRIGQSTT
ncbi:hypothetical protein AB0D90_21700 [Streptomyces althioticus]|uniref:hypothetical protein n=1 Tax=Streptomyces althioticus TaxID=83380 RepID=UPI0033DC5C01